MAIFILIWSGIKAQCPPPGYPLPGDSCHLAPILCQSLEGYCGTLDTNINIGPIPDCSNGAGFNNTAWLGFYAGSTTLAIQIIPSNCTGNVNSHGIQAALIEGSCTGPVMDNQCACGNAGTSPFILQNSNFVIGELYYLVLDGCGGDICDYEIQVLEGTTLNSVEVIGDIEGPSEMCIGGISLYTVSTVNGSNPGWYIEPPDIGNFIGPYYGDSITIEWVHTGTASVCIFPDTICNAITPPCVEIMIVPSSIPPQDLYYDVCFGECQVCAEMTFCESTIPEGESVTLQGAGGCDSVIVCHVNILPEISTDLGRITLCAPEEFQSCNTLYAVSGLYSNTCTSIQGCDSVVIFDLGILEPISTILPPGLLACGPLATLELNGSFSSHNNLPGGTTEFHWTGPGIISNPNMEVIEINLPGTYCLEVIHTRDNIACSDITCVAVEQDNAVPQEPELLGDGFPCLNTFNNYTVIPVNIPEPTSFSWATPNGEPFTLINETTIGILWSEISSGVLCVTANNDCGSSSPACISITVMNGDTVMLQSETCDPNEAGVFTQQLINQFGCDSIITTTVILQPSDSTLIQSSTCIPANAGVFVTHLTNQDGCDSVVLEQVIFTVTDSTFISTTTCNPDLSGVFLEAFINSEGCDSIVTTTVHFSESDTTYTIGMTCDPSMAGTFYDALNNTAGCDSIIIHTIQLLNTDTTILFSSTCDSLLAGIFYDTLTNTAGCDSLVITTRTFRPSDNIILHLTSCDSTDIGTSVQEFVNQYGCDSIVTTYITFSLSDTTNLLLGTCDSSQAGVFKFVYTNQFGCDSLVTYTLYLLESHVVSIQSTTCDPDLAGSFSDTLTNQFGCDSIVFTTIDLLPQPQVVLESVYRYNGFDISCYGAEDAAIRATIINGQGPYAYLWSDTSSGEELNHIGPGHYTITVTDVNGCTTSEAIELNGPENIEMVITIGQLDCFGDHDGTINVATNGGVQPFTFELNDGNAQSTGFFTGLGMGSYGIKATDANGCTSLLTITIDEPYPLEVELGEDQFIMLGQSTTLEAVINLPADSLYSIIWSPIDSSGCDRCLVRFIEPHTSTNYTIRIVDYQGCADEDQMTVFVNAENLFIPTVFSPNGDGLNDYFTLYSKSYVQEIVLFEIFDRWGGKLYSRKNFQPNIPEYGWDGLYKDKPVSPGVYVYRIQFIDTDGHLRSEPGEITVVK